MARGQINTRTVLNDKEKTIWRRFILYRVFGVSKQKAIVIVADSLGLSHTDVSNTIQITKPDGCFQ